MCCITTEEKDYLFLFFFQLHFYTISTLLNATYYNINLYVPTTSSFTQRNTTHRVKTHQPQSSQRTACRNIF